ncbi:MAG: hypothetical protein ACJ8FS_05850 [Sphingomicrobium sp.]
MSQSPETAGGAGFTFADRVAARYLASLLVEASAPGLADRRVSRVALEQRSSGEPLDDLIVDAVAPDGSTARLSLQVKRELVISAGKSNEDFRAIICDAWATLDKEDFRDGVDRVGAAVGPSTAVATSRDLQAIAEFARASATPSDFALRFADGGSASKAHHAIMSSIQTITADLSRPASVADIHRLLSHFVLIRFDALHAGATDDPIATTLLEHALEPPQANQNVALSDRIQNLAREGAGVARSWETNDLRRQIAPFFKLAVLTSRASDLRKLDEEVRQAAASIADRIGDAAVARPVLRASVTKALVEYSVVTLRGLPGSGKSALLRQVVEEALAAGSTILLKADRLSGASWAQYAASFGLDAPHLQLLLEEIEIAGTPVLFIDGLDRIDKAQRGIVLDLLNAIAQSPGRAGWRVLATLRDSGVEPVRTWLPQMLDDGRVASIRVDTFNDEEAAALAKARPHLRSLLFGAEPVRSLVRRAFFAKILDETTVHAISVPGSEPDLIVRWWSRGGFDASGSEARLRQRTLLRLVRLRALQPDSPVAVDSLDDSLLPSVEPLVRDGVLDETDNGHFVRFAHDIFFEWSFAQLLASAGARWVEKLTATGEPPGIGRAVDLHAQTIFLADGAAWEQTLKALAEPSLRSQWRRIWLLAPISHPTFLAQAATYDAAVMKNEHELLRMALVWFQAQHVVPNSGVLDGSLGQIADRDVRARTADLMGWPDDFSLWIRFLHYIDGRLPVVPHRLLPRVLALFEVWQNAMADHANSVSAMIVERVSGWLIQLEERQARMGRFVKDHSADVPDPWSDLDDRSEFETASRHLLLRAARTEDTRVSGYLRSFGPERAARSKTFDDIMTFAPLLARTHPGDLANFALNHFKRELPEDHRRRRLEEDRRERAHRERLLRKPPTDRGWADEMTLTSPSLGYWGPERWDWDALALEREPTGYFPASPLHEPFHSLFEAAPDEGLRLVKAMSNHAVEAWRQLHRLQRDSGTPVPITVDFPWGPQRFWGGAREYLWSRGLWAPKPLASAYLALDQWALGQVEAGARVDTLIEQVVTDHHSIAALGTAVQIALANPGITPVSEALIKTQRLWRADVQRCAQEPSISTSSQIGFTRPEQRTDALAVQALNKRAVRSTEIRTLATLHVLQNDAAAAERVRAAISDFGKSPDFELEEEREHDAARASAEEIARTYAAWGNVEHYRLVELPDQHDRQAVVMVNPIVEEPAVRARLEEGQAHLKTFSLFNWAEQSFEKGELHGSFSLDQAIETARSIDSPALFGPAGDDDRTSMTRGAVTGVAAAVVAFAPDLHSKWAREVLARAATAREERGPLWTSVGIISWHHAIFVARAAAADFRRNPQDQTSAETLFRSLIHPLDCVGLEAAKLIASLWEVAPALSWHGLGLALHLCIVAAGELGDDTLHNPEAGQDGRQRKLDAVLAHLQGAPKPLPIPPEPWVHAEANYSRRTRNRSRNPEAVTWRPVDGWWRSDRAAEILRAQPIQTVLASGFGQLFVEYCEAMLEWTIERNAPSWAQYSRDVEHADVYEWTRRFGELLGGLTGLVDPEIAALRFVDPICGLADDPCFDLLAPLVTMFLCQHVLDAPVAAPFAPTLLDKATNRLLEASALNQGRYRAGELYGFSIPELARWLMFVGVEHAPLSHRFANGDWSEIALILPSVNRFARKAGWVPTIMSHYLTLVQRAGEHFPAEQFADAILAALTVTADPGSRWRGTSIAARIASQVQSIADREAPLDLKLGQKLLRILDLLVDQGDRRSAALQIGPAFRDLRLRAID